MRLATSGLESGASFVGPIKPNAAPLPVPSPKPSTLIDIELTLDQYLRAVQDGLWNQIHGSAGEGFRNDRDVANARRRVQAIQPTKTKDVTASADIAQFIQAIAEPTAGAKIGGANQNFEKAIVLSRNSKGEVVVAAIAVLGPQGGTLPRVPRRIAVAHVHQAGLVQPPHGGDDNAVRVGVSSFVIGESGRAVWEIGKVSGEISIRLLIDNQKFGPWERYQTNPRRYRIYNMEKFP